MGLDIDAIRFVLERSPIGPALTLGRQNLFAGSNETNRLLKEYGYAEADLRPYSRFQYADAVWESMFRQKTHTLDMVGADICHDLNKPGLTGAYNTVMDFGTLEHIFNFPQALETSDLLNQLGVFLSVTPCNNYPGHGFYQFSPEVFFRGLPGFAVQVWVRYGKGSLIEVHDPAEVKARSNLRHGGAPTTLFVYAIKRFGGASDPQQSDYAAQWSGTDVAAQHGGEERFPILKMFLKEHFPRVARRLEAVHERFIV